MKTIIALIVVVFVTVKVIFCAVDNIAPQVQQATDNTEQIVALATE